MNNRLLHGFTLIEMVITMVVMAILFATVMFMWPGQSINLDAQKQRVIADIRFIQHYAQTNNQRTRINFNSGGYTLTLSNGTTAVNQPAINTNTVSLPGGMTLATSGGITNGYVIFNALGQPYSDNANTKMSSNGTVTLSADGSSVTVTIVPDTGRVIP